MVLFLLIFSSCEKVFDWQYPEITEEIPVVETIITNELKHHEVRLSLVRSDPNQSALPLVDAIVHVAIGGNSYEFAEMTGNPGTYVSLQPFIGVSGTEIKLQVEWKDMIYTATDNMQPVSPTNRGLFLPVGIDSSLYYLVQSASIFFTNEPAMWEFNIFWDFLPEYVGHDPDSCRARIFYYELKGIDQGQIFAPQQQNIYFPKGAIVYQTKYSLSEEHKKFRRSLLLETEWRGGLMDVSPGSVYTNVSNGGMGFFGASSVLRDTFYIQ